MSAEKTYFPSVLSPDLTKLSVEEGAEQADRMHIIIIKVFRGQAFSLFGLGVFPTRTLLLAVIVVVFPVFAFLFPRFVETGNTVIPDG